MEEVRLANNPDTAPIPKYVADLHHQLIRERVAWDQFRMVLTSDVGFPARCF